MIIYHRASESGKALSCFMICVWASLQCRRILGVRVHIFAVTVGRSPYTASSGQASSYNPRWRHRTDLSSVPLRNNACTADYVWASLFLSLLMYASYTRLAAHQQWVSRSSLPFFFCDGTQSLNESIIICFQLNTTNTTPNLLSQWVHKIRVVKGGATFPRRRS